MSILPPDNKTVHQTDRVRDTIRAWLPHILLLGLILAGLWLVAQVIWPLQVPLLLAGATAALTHPVLYQPLSKGVDALVPRWSAPLRRQTTAVLTTILLVLLLLSPVLLLILTVINNLTEGLDFVLGVVFQDQERLGVFFSKLTDKIDEFAKAYPALQINAADLVQNLRETIAASNKLGPTVLQFLFKGSSRIAEIVFALISLSFFYAHGPQLMQNLLQLSPMSQQQQDKMIRRHALISEYILISGIGTAIVKGALLGLIVWTARLSAGLGEAPVATILLVPPILISMAAAVLSLLPMVGLTMVWLPLAITAWSQGAYGTALYIGLASLLMNHGFDYLRHTYQRNKGMVNEAWLNFGLFLGLVGGVLAFGALGLIIGPAAVSIAALLGRHGLPVYQIGSDDEEV